MLVFLRQIFDTSSNLFVISQRMSFGRFSNFVFELVLSNRIVDPQGQLVFCLFVEFPSCFASFWENAIFHVLASFLFPLV